MEAQGAMSWPKRSNKVTVRLTDAMHEAVSILAGLQERSILDQTRYLIRLGLDYERKTLRNAKLAPNLNAARARFLQLFGEDV